MMKVKIHALLSECIERGILRGYQRSYKHTDSPNELSICENIHDAIMEDICEFFDFDDEFE